MLGFSAIGQLALGEPPDGLTFQLVATVGSFLMAGQAAPLTPTAVGETSAYSLAGTAAEFLVKDSATAGAFNLTGAAATLTPRIIASAAAYTVTINGPVLTTGAFTITGIPSTFLVRQNSQFGTEIINAQFGFAALGQVPLGGGSAEIADRVVSIQSAGAILTTTLPASPVAYSLTPYPATLTPRVMAVTGAFTISGTASFTVGWKVSTGAYSVTLGGLVENEIWIGHGSTGEIWTDRINDTGITITANTQFGMVQLGTLALGQGVYSPQIYSEGWTVKTKTTVWTPINSDVRA